VKLFKFDSSVGHPVDRFDSRNFSISRILKDPKNVERIGSMNIGNDGVVGFHQATCSQLFLVVNGSGWVTDKSRERSPIKAGQAAFWNKDEWHESGSETGMTVIVIEGEDLKPEAFMPLL